MKPGDTLAGQGFLLQHGRLIAKVDYHLTIPPETHFVINPTGGLHVDYAMHLGGFILAAPEDVPKIQLTGYTLELADKSRKPIQVERRYKEVKQQGQRFVSFWVSAAKP
jgi:hypothetical protein